MALEDLLAAREKIPQGDLGSAFAQKEAQQQGIVGAIMEGIAEDIRTMPHVMDFLSAKYWDPNTPAEQKDLALKALWTIASWVVPMGVGTKLFKMGRIASTVLGGAAGGAMAELGDNPKAPASDILGGAAAGGILGGGFAIATGKLGARFGKKSVAPTGGGGAGAATAAAEAVPPPAGGRPALYRRTLDTNLAAELKASGLDRSPDEWVNNLFRSSGKTLQGLSDDETLTALNALRAARGKPVEGRARFEQLMLKRDFMSGEVKYELEFSDEAGATLWDDATAKTAAPLDALYASIIKQKLSGKPGGVFKVGSYEDVLVGNPFVEAFTAAAETATGRSARVVEQAALTAPAAAEEVTGYVLPVYRGAIKEVSSQDWRKLDHRNMVSYGGEKLSQGSKVWIHPKTDDRTGKVIEGTLTGVSDNDLKVGTIKKGKNRGNPWISRTVTVTDNEGNTHRVSFARVTAPGYRFKVAAKGGAPQPSGSVSTADAWELVEPDPKYAGPRGTEVGLKLPNGLIVHAGAEVQVASTERFVKKTLSTEEFTIAQGTAAKQAREDLSQAMRSYRGAGSLSDSTRQQVFKMLDTVFREGVLPPGEVGVLRKLLYEGNEALMAADPSKLSPAEQLKQEGIEEFAKGLVSTMLDARPNREFMASGGGKAGFKGKILEIYRTKSGGVNVKVLPEGKVDPADAQNVVAERVGTPGMTFPKKMPKKGIRETKEERIRNLADKHEAAVARYFEMIKAKIEAGKTVDNPNLRATLGTFRKSVNQQIEKLEQIRQKVQESLRTAKATDLDVDSPRGEWARGRREVLAKVEAQLKRLYEEKDLLNKGATPSQVYQYLQEVRGTSAVNEMFGTNLPKPSPPVVTDIPPGEPVVPPPVERPMLDAVNMMIQDNDMDALKGLLNSSGYLELTGPQRAQKLIEWFGPGESRAKMAWAHLASKAKKK